MIFSGGLYANRLVCKLALTYWSNFLFFWAKFSPSFSVCESDQTKILKESRFPITTFVYQLLNIVHFFSFNVMVHTLQIKVNLHFLKIKCKKSRTQKKANTLTFKRFSENKTQICTDHLTLFNFCFFEPHLLVNVNIERITVRFLTQRSANQLSNWS